MNGREKLLFARRLLVDWRARMLASAEKFGDKDVFLRQAAALQADIERIDAIIAGGGRDVPTPGGPGID
jgi:hypothetical protein